MKQNAISEQDKLERRAAFLASARRLFSAQQRLPAVADIAADTGLAKGTVYRYFHSKEEIFIALLTEDFSALFDGLSAVIPALPDQPQAAAMQFAQAYTTRLQTIPTLLPLAAMLNAVLEQNLPGNVLQQFKQLLAQALNQLGCLLAAKFGHLTPAQGSNLLLHNYALTLGLWQTLHYPPAVRALLQQPELQSLNRDFVTELPLAIANQWLGALNS